MTVTAFAAHAIDKYVSLTIILVGMITNGLSYAIYSRKSFARDSASFYSRLLLVCDTVGLFHYLIEASLSIGFGMNLNASSSLACTLLYYMLFSIAAVSPWLLVLISFDRMVCIVWPMRLLALTKRRFQALASIAMFAYNFVYYVELAIFREYFEYAQSLPASNDTAWSTRQCEWSSYGRQVITIMDTINFTVLPFLCMCATSGLTLNAIYSSRARLIAARRFGSSQKQLNTNDVGSSSGSVSRIRRNAQRAKKDLQFVFTSCMLNLAFLLMTLPANVDNYMIIEDNSSRALVGAVCNMLYYGNHASFFFINLFANKRFRSELDAICTRRTTETNTKRRT
jgi:hypothetical protein